MSCFILAKRGGDMSKTNSLWIIVIVCLFGIAVITSVVLGIAFIIIEPSIGGKVAVIPIKGVITTENSEDFFSLGTTSSSEIISLIEKAQNSASVKGILFEINSPGGSAVASDEIAQAIGKIEKPKVAWIRDAGTSGAYLAASATDKIVASRMSITGSIGVISSYMEFSGLMKNYNITYQRLVAGELKDIGTPFKELTEEEESLLQLKLDKIHDIFIKEVALNRNMPEYKVRELATGVFYLGLEAKELGLIDEIGGKDAAVDILEGLIGEDDLTLIQYQPKSSFFSSFGQVFMRDFFDTRIKQGILLQ